MSSFYNCDKENIIISNRFKRKTLSNRRFNKYYVSHDKLNPLTKLPSNTKDRQCGRIAEISVFLSSSYSHKNDAQKQTPQVTISSTSLADAILHLLLP